MSIFILKLIFFIHFIFFLLFSQKILVFLPVQWHNECHIPQALYYVEVIQTATLYSKKSKKQKYLSEKGEVYGQKKRKFF